MKSIALSLLTVAAMFGSVVTASAETAVPKDYPLKKCPVSGETYGDGGMKPYKVSHDGTDVWLCCKSCKKDFDKEPAKFTSMVKDAAAKK
jgi:YHS domain-containing protein